MKRPWHPPLFAAALLAFAGAAVWPAHPLSLSSAEPVAVAKSDPAPTPPQPAPTPTPATIISVPKAVTTNKRGTATIEVTTTGKSVIVANAADDVTDVFRLYSDDPAKWLFRFEGDAPGAYKLIFVTSVNDRPALASCVVTIPGPPTPVPPTPPTPSNPLTATFQAAYLKDTDANKAASLGFLTSVYRAGDAILTADVKTNADLLGRLSAVIHTPGVGIPKGAMPNLMGAIGAELNAALGTSATAAVDTAKTKAEFAKISSALSEVK